MRLADSVGASNNKVTLITGASGNLGAKLARYFVKSGRPLILLDQIPHPNLAVREADLSKHGNWANLFAGVDVVIHLAGASHLNSSRTTYKSENVDCTANVLGACEQYAVRRIIFASSLHVMGGYREGGKRITESLPPRPDGSFARSKLQCETMLSKFPDVFCLRLGWSPRYNVREAALTAPKRLREMWLSDADFLRAVDLATDADNQGFTVLNITSDVANGQYPLKAAREALGYKPQDGLNKTQIVMSKLSNSLFRRGRTSH